MKNALIAAVLLIAAAAPTPRSGLEPTSSRASSVPDRIGLPDVAQPSARDIRGSAGRDAVRLGIPVLSVASGSPSTAPANGPDVVTRNGADSGVVNPAGAVGTVAIGVKGTATWYRYHTGQAAAAARLRDALGPHWRGMVVQVCGPVGCRLVRLTDYESSRIPGRLIDLDTSDFVQTCGALSIGVCQVTVTSGSEPLPPTDEAEPVWLSGWAR